MRAFNKQGILSYITLLVSFIFLGFVYFYKIKYYPLFGGDEASLLSIPYRAVTFSDFQYAVFAPRSVFELGPLGCTPFCNVYSLRVLFHLIFGFSAELSRIFSAVLTLIPTFFVVALCRKNHPSLSFWKLGLITVSIGLTPAMFLNARILRFEQEILFWGVVGIFGLLLWLSKARSKPFVLLSSGFCVGMAAIAHPFGLVFPIVIFGSFFLHHQAWNRFDNLKLTHRLVFWSAGFLCPVGAVVGDILLHLQGYLFFLEGLPEAQAIRSQTFIEIFSNHYNHSGLFHEWLPIRLKALIYQISHYSFNTEFIPFFTKSYGFLFLGCTILPFLCLFQIIKRKNQPAILPLAISSYLAIGYLLFTAIFTPNQTYYIYLSFFYSTFLCVLYYDNSFFSKKFLFITHIIVYALFSLNVLSSYSFLHSLKNIYLKESVSLDSILQNVKKLNKNMKMSELSQGETLVDSYTWPFAGENIGSWVTTLAGRDSKNLPIAGAFRGDAIDFFINVFPTKTRIQVPESIKRQNFHRIRDQLTLQGILVVPSLQLDYYFYVKSTAKKPHFQFLIMNNDSETLFFSKDINDPLPEKAASHTPNQFLGWKITQDGEYLLILTSEVEGVNRSHIKFVLNRSPIEPSLQSSNTQETPIFYLLKLKKGSFQIQGVSPQYIKAFYHLILDPQ